MAITVRKVNLQNKSRKGEYWYVKDTETKVSRYYKADVPEKLVRDWFTTSQLLTYQDSSEKRKVYNYIKGQSREIVVKPTKPSKEDLELDEKLTPKLYGKLPKGVNFTKKNQKKLTVGNHVVKSSKEELLHKPDTKLQELFKKTGVTIKDKKVLKEQSKQIAPITEHTIVITGINERTNKIEDLVTLFIHNKTINQIKDEIGLRLYAMTQDGQNKYIKDVLVPFKPFINTQTIHVPRGIIKDFNIQTTVKVR